MFEITILDGGFEFAEVGTFDGDRPEIGGDVAGLGCRIVEIREISESGKTAVVVIEWLD